MYKICPKRGCPKIAVGRYCPTHNSEHEKKRGTRQQRGYDAKYDRDRKWWEVRVELGLVDCWRPDCRALIEPGSEWHLGHADEDRTIVMGPEHKSCNLKAAGKSSHQ